MNDDHVRFVNRATWFFIGFLVAIWIVPLFIMIATALGL